MESARIRSLVVLLTLSAAALAAPGARACDCSGGESTASVKGPFSPALGLGGRPAPPVAVSRDKAAAVFAGTVLAVHDPIPLNAPIPATGLVFDYTFAVDRLWKGDLPETVAVRTVREIEDCGSTFDVDRTYLVYAYEREGQLWVDTCTRTQPAGTAVLDLYELGEPVRTNGSDAVPMVTLDSLIGDFKDVDWAVRQRAMRSVAELDGGYDKTVPALAEVVMSGQGNDRFVAAQALARIGPEATAAVPTLSALLTDPNLNIGRVCAVALGEIGPGARSAVPALLDAAENEDNSYRASVIRALARIAPDDPAVEKVVKRAVKDPSPEVSTTAKSELRRIEAAKH